eukprot:CAMPEP_0182468052 /NCGR_PEP_ID=MMETSP1319-20130603/14900_1 /TAXON_ID=172717 /ORGANISM="Bolidomonas pacifica, Strain RCC208" /LENGTH=51 /DNA_ID=CAMNT_0024668215 /DNA_START=49 /DNA_END=204 /DNA_ORIENTATION=-
MAFLTSVAMLAPPATHTPPLNSSRCLATSSSFCLTTSCTYTFLACALLKAW